MCSTILIYGLSGTDISSIAVLIERSSVGKRQAVVKSQRDLVDRILN